MDGYRPWRSNARWQCSTLQAGSGDQARSHHNNLPTPGRAIEAKLREYAPDAEIYFERLTVTPIRIEMLESPRRLTKAMDNRANGFGTVSVELDAIPPGTLRNLVRQTIERHLPQHELRA